MKVLIVGLGSIGRRHVESLFAVRPQAVILALRTTANNAPEHPNVTRISNVDELTGLNIDFAIISNPTSEHKRTIEKLLPFGFPLFIEKPLHHTLEMQPLVEWIENSKISTYVACNLRFLKCLSFVQERIKTLQGKRLNEVNIYCGSYLPDWRREIDYRKSYSAGKDSGGGVHLDLIHELDYLYWIFGRPKQVRRSFSNQSSLGIEAVDYANYLVDYEGFSANVVLNYYRRDAKRTFELVFGDETWYVDLLKNTVTCKSELIFESDQNILDTYDDQMKYFVECLEEHKTPFNSVMEAFEVLKVCIER